MKNILGKIRGATDRGVVVGIAVIVLLVIIFGVVRFTSNDSSDNSAMKKDGEGSDVTLEEVTEPNTNIAGASAALPRTTMVVKIPVLAGELFDMTSGKKRGCDNVVFIEKEVARTPAVLNATLVEMFNYSDDPGFLPGNFVKSQAGLSFDRAEIEDGVAKVYLEGETGPLAGVCDNPRLNIQIEEAALQFSTVSSVEIYLNGELYEMPTEA